MNSAISLTQRDEFHVFIALSLHIVLGLLFYALITKSNPPRPSVELKGLPVLIGPMIATGTQEENGQTDPVTASGSPDAVLPTIPQLIDTVPQRPAKPTDAAEKPLAETEPGRIQPPRAQALAQPSVAESVRPVLPAPSAKSVGEAPQPRVLQLDPSSRVTTDPPRQVAVVDPNDVTQAVPAALQAATLAEVEPVAERTGATAQQEASSVASAPAAPDEVALPANAAAETSPEAAAVETEPPQQAETPSENATVETEPPQQAETPPETATVETEPTQRAEPSLAPNPPAAAVADATIAPNAVATDGQPGPPLPRTRPPAPDRPVTVESTTSTKEPDDSADVTVPVPSPRAVTDSAVGPNRPQRLRDAWSALAPRLSSLPDTIDGRTDSGATDGQNGSHTGSYDEVERQGSMMAQICLDAAGVFKAYDNVSATLDLQVDRARRYLSVWPNYELHHGRDLQPPRLEQIERALNDCPDFVGLVVDRQRLNKFSVRFTSGGR